MPDKAHSLGFYTQPTAWPPEQTPPTPGCLGRAGVSGRCCCRHSELPQRATMSRKQLQSLASLLCNDLAVPLCRQCAQATARHAVARLAPRQQFVHTVFRKSYTHLSRSEHLGSFQTYTRSLTVQQRSYCRRGGRRNRSGRQARAEAVASDIERLMQLRAQGEAVSDSDLMHVLAAASDVSAELHGRASASQCHLSLQRSAQRNTRCSAQLGRHLSQTSSGVCSCAPGAALPRHSSDTCAAASPDT